MSDHYVFPEEHAAAGREEVRTVEEEALFRVAYPEVVELYLTEKALAENKKTKSKAASCSHYYCLLVVTERKQNTSKDNFSKRISPSIDVTIFSADTIFSVIK